MLVDNLQQSCISGCGRGFLRRDITNHIVNDIGKVLSCLPRPRAPPHPHLPLQDVIPRPVWRAHFVSGLGALNMKPHSFSLASVFLPPENLDRDHLVVVLRIHHRGESKFNEVIHGPHGLRGVRQLVEGADATLV